MSATGLYTAEFGGEQHQFRIWIGELRQIQEKCGEGPPEIMARLAPCVIARMENPKATLLQLAAVGLGSWRVDDIRETIFRGLIGGGATPNAAGQLVKQWIDERGFQGLVENAGLALELLLLGWGTPAGEGESAAGETSAPEKSTSDPSTAPAPPSASPPVKSTK